VLVGRAQHLLLLSMQLLHLEGVLHDRRREALRRGCMSVIVGAKCTLEAVLRAESFEQRTVLHIRHTQSIAWRSIVDLLAAGAARVGNDAGSGNCRRSDVCMPKQHHWRRVESQASRYRDQT